MNSLHHRFALGSVGLALIAGLTACSSDSTPSTEADVGVGPTDAGVGPADSAVADAGVGPADSGVGSADAGVAPADAAVARTMATVAGFAQVDGEPVAGAVVTVVDRAGATVTTGATGAFSFSLPIGSTQLLRMTHASARTIQIAMVVPAEDPTDFTLDSISNAEFDAFNAGLGLVEDTAAGTLLLHFSSTAPNMHASAGFGATLSVPGGVRFVVPDSGPRRQDTSLPGDRPFLIANVPAGTVTVTPTAPAGLSCTPTNGTATVRVDARTITEVNFSCR